MCPVAPGADCGGDFATDTEAGIKRAVGVVACNRKVVVAAVPGRTHHQYLAIGLQRQVVTEVVAGAECGDDLAVAHHEGRRIVDRYTGHCLAAGDRCGDAVADSGGDREIAVEVG